MTTPIQSIALPSILVVSSSIYQRAYHDRRRAGSLLEEAAQLGADISMLRIPTTWEELNPFVKTAKAVISKRKAYLKRIEKLEATAT